MESRIGTIVMNILDLALLKALNNQELTIEEHTILETYLPKSLKQLPNNVLFEPAAE